MLILCDEIQNENGEKHLLYPEYERTLKDKVEWYQFVYKEYSNMLKNESKGNQPDYDAGYEILAKKESLDIIQPLIKLALSRFSYGPTKKFFAENGFDTSFNPGDKKMSYDKSWLENTADLAVLLEILAYVLKKTETEYDFDLKVLEKERGKRNKATHQGARIECMTLIRIYESIRGLLIFLDTDNESLPHFQDDSCFDYDSLISEPCSFSFKETATVLIVDSIHDIAKGYRSVVANLPWDLVIDFDGYSGTGGLLSSVEHNSIRKELLTADKSYTLPSLNRMQTMWYRCGDYLLPHYHTKKRIDILGYKDFLSYTGRFQHDLKKQLENVLKNLTVMQRFVNILILSDDGRIANSTIDALRDLNFDDYFVSWVGFGESDVESGFFNNEGEEFCQEHFYHHECQIVSFFKAFYEYRENWKPRISVKIDYALPTKGDGSFVSLSENTRNNLTPYFEVLYKDWDSVEHPDDVYSDPFYKGGRATWKDIASGEALQLNNEKETKLKDRIKSTTGRAQEDCPQKNLFLIKHKAGIGGTTFVKQVAWKLHNDMAVLEVKHYDERKTFLLLQDLYDNIIEKNPILLVAEDTLPYLEAMCDAFLVYMKSRRCALIIACRDDNRLFNKYRNSQITELKHLRADAIETLKYKFMSISTLSKNLLTERTRRFDDEVGDDMRTPFIIGLYFLEKEFRIESYISKVLDNNSILPMQKNMIALLALCDKYNSKELPSSFVNRELGYNSRRRSSLIQSCPGAESIICRGRKVVEYNGDSVEVEVYYFKHILLSEKYFEMYTQDQYKGLKLYNLTKKLIELTANCQVGAEQKYVANTLLHILIRDKDPDIYYLSQLLTDIAIPDSQRSLIEYLAEQFRPSADKILSKKADKILREKNIIEVEKEHADDDNILRIVSHAYAHLGMLYTKYPVNYEKAIKHLSSAEYYMPYDDKFIYHMYGIVLYRKLCKQWAADIDNYDSDKIISLPDYDEVVNKTFELFGKTSELGEVQYGITGQLNLLYEYLKFIYRVNRIYTNEDLRKLTPKQMTYLTLFIDTLDIAKQYDDFDEKAVDIIQSKENQLRSNVLMGDFGKTIEYYHNEYEKQKSSNNTEYMLLALHGLVSARIQKAKESYNTAKSKSLSFYHMISDPTTLFEQLEILLPSLYNQGGYSAYTKRTALFRHWFQLAKLLDHSVNEAMIKARYWVDSEKEIRGKKNPEPFYYQVALLCLEIIEGGERESELLAAYSVIDRMDRQQQFDPRRGRMDRIKDILVTGTGIGKLLNVSDCAASEDIANRISATNKMPIELSGSVETAQYWGAEISVFDPPALKKLKIISEIGRMAKNTLSEQQINHKIKCFSGFTLRGIRAVSDSVKDQDTGELFDLSKIINEMRGLKVADSTNAKKSPATHLEPKRAPLLNQQNRSINRTGDNDIDLIGSLKAFHPRRIFYDKYDKNKPLYLNGDVDDGVGGIAIQYLFRIFGESRIDVYGGVCSILEMLIEKKIVINAKVESVRETDKGKQYTLILYDESIELSQLLQLQKDMEIPTYTNQVETSDTQVFLIDYKGREVIFIPDDATLASKRGKFVIDGTEYQGTLTNVKSPKDKKKAKNFEGKIPAVILGKPQSGIFSLKMK